MASSFFTAVGPIFANVINPLVWLAFAVAFVFFAFGVIQMITHETDAEAHQRGRLSILWGIIGMFIMFSAWGIINIIANTVKSL